MQREQEPEQRYLSDKERQILTRFLFANFGGLLAVAGMLVSGGMFMREFYTVNSTLNDLRVQVSMVVKDNNTVQRDVAVIESRVNTLERAVEIERPPRRAPQ